VLEGVLPKSNVMFLVGKRTQCKGYT
jgi:hypothetical protein